MPIPFGLSTAILNPTAAVFGNLSEALAPFGINSDSIPVCFNIFMHVTVDGETGVLKVFPPKSKAGDHIIIESRMDLIIGMTACSAEMSNNYSFKSIGYQIL